MSAPEPEPVAIRGAMIRLGQLLKLAGIAADGGEAKALLEAGHVHVNGAAEHRRGRQLHDGDVVSAAGGRVRVVAAPPAEGE
jgi:ribosome-associated protein